MYAKNWAELSAQCMSCQHLHTHPKMDGGGEFWCGRYPLKAGEHCPEYVRNFESEQEEAQHGNRNDLT